MNLQKYNFRVTDNITSYRIWFTIDGKERYRSIKSNLSLMEIIDNLYDFLETGKCSIKPIPLAFSGIRTAITEHENVASMNDTYEQVLVEYESDIKDLQEKLNDAVNTINKLSGSLQFIKSKNLGSDFENLEEYECIMETLTEFYNTTYQNTAYDSKRKIILENFLGRKSFESKKKDVATHIKKTLYDSFSTGNGFDMNKLRRGLSEVGLDISTQGHNHDKVFVIGHEQCSTSISRTPSDYRSLENCARTLTNLLFK